MDPVLGDSRHFAGVVQHSELVHVQRCVASLLRGQSLSSTWKTRVKNAEEMIFFTSTLGQTIQQCAGLTCGSYSSTVACAKCSHWSSPTASPQQGASSVPGRVPVQQSSRRAEKGCGPPDRRSPTTSPSAGGERREALA